MRRKERSSFARLSQPRYENGRRLHDEKARRHRRLLYLLCLAGLALLTAAVSYSAVRIGLYLVQGRRSAQLNRELQAIYRSATEPLPAPETESMPAAAGEAQAEKLLPALQYPPLGTALRTRFLQLQRRNADIIGWLSVGGLLEEAVVQRDNAYYLKRDSLGYHNVNGAIFLDEACSLRERPYTYILYGHNMKTQAMFGCLHRYEEPDFYRANPFITFDTCHEAGRYVIFAVANVSLDSKAPDYLDLNKLNSTTVMWREAVIKQLAAQSRYTAVVDVAPDEQVLLLVTCRDEEGDERRVIAARRIRAAEEEEALLAAFQSSYRRQ